MRLKKETTPSTSARNTAAARRSSGCYVDLNNNDATTYWSKDYGESPFDRMIIAPDRLEFKYSRQYVLRSSDLFQHDRFLSDHYMIKMSVKDYVDDADPR